MDQGLLPLPDRARHCSIGVMEYWRIAFYGIPI